MDNWQPPIEAEAYRVRSSNTITSKDRLLDYCELASLNDNGYMEPEIDSRLLGPQTDIGAFLHRGVDQRLTILLMITS